MDTLEAVESGIQKLRSDGHTVKVWVRDKWSFWFEIDGYALASEDEMEELGMGVYSLSELHELYVIRKRSEKELRSKE